MNLDSAVSYSNDIEQAIAFYTNVLGFIIEYRHDNNYVSFIFPNNARLGIKKKVEVREVPGAQTVFISVEKIDELYAKLQEKNIVIYKKLVTQEWGKNFSILDPDQNKIQCVEKITT